ncbi:DUF2141 domain-containing protein [Chlorobaculum sp. MV4-Y]|uniref:DUF2141 domain-containing protein n=1 Tax=Chlorobaculum sp. MV4-Y TaxID=2976335 RepID=UPI0021AFD41F|nr:DUF2141 domain-containing protein [Chlorobaculum sp. MV4-Y]UWX58293.1 DUF2141 domain-containing protein [Chlorobaculum sp. MV4-Y]
MKRSLWLFIVALLAMQLPAVSQIANAAEPEVAEIPAGSGSITIRITGLRSSDGNLSLALFNAKKGFPGKYERAVRKAQISVAGSQHVVVFDDVPYGTYAVAVQHDENANGKLDANFLGMPKEGVGTSNNPKSKFGPPSFDDASFVLDKKAMELTINLRYL